MADYAIHGFPGLTTNVAKTLGGHTAALIGNHRSVVIGPDLASAYILVQELE